MFLTDDRQAADAIDEFTNPADGCAVERRPPPSFAAILASLTRRQRYHLDARTSGGVVLFAEAAR